MSPTTTKNMNQNRKDMGSCICKFIIKCISSHQTKVLVVDMLSSLAKQTDNEVDDAIVEEIQNKLQRDESKLD